MDERAVTEPIEIDVEQLSYVPGHRVDRLAGARRRWERTLASAGGQHVQGWSAPTVSTAVRTALTGSTSFWRIVDVPGEQLGRVLADWWLRSNHDDGRLRMGEPYGRTGTWQLAGSLRVTPISKRFAIDVRLAPHAQRWSLLELTPRRPIRPTRLYFQVGHDSLDLFAATLRDLA